jgi:Mg2+-importing ATPase
MGSASTTVSETAHDAASRLEGLTQREAEERLRQVGPNHPSPRKRAALLIELLVLFLNPLVIILLIAVLISVVVGQVADASIIFVIAMLGVVINFIQTYRSERSIRRLREHVSLTASVLRDGNWHELPRENVVPGDLVRLSAGDLVPADGFLLKSRALYVQQVALTGESMPAEKQARAEPGEPNRETPNWVSLGTAFSYCRRSCTGIDRLGSGGECSSRNASVRNLTSRKACRPHIGRKAR